MGVFARIHPKGDARALPAAIERHHQPRRDGDARKRRSIRQKARHQPVRCAVRRSAISILEFQMSEPAAKTRTVPGGSDRARLSAAIRSW